MLCSHADPAMLSGPPKESVMKNVLAAIALSCLTLILSAPSAQAQRGTLNAQPATVVSSPTAMDAVLGDLERVSAATDNDIADIRTERRGGSWMTSWMFWRRSSTPPNPPPHHIAPPLPHNPHHTP